MLTLIGVAYYEKRRNNGMKKKLVVGLDVDDTIGICMAAALERWKTETGVALTPYDVTGWVGAEAGWVKYFSDPVFVANQPVVPGAQRFVRELIKRGCDVLITTAVPMNVASARAAWVQKNFPEIKPENFIIGKRKDIYALDVMIDDAPHNILTSKATYPILMRKPWNQNVTGLMAANDFDDCLNLIDTIMRQNGYVESIVPTDVVCLVGPSGSGKHEVIQALRERGYTVPPIFTTNKSVTQNYYRIIDKEEFEHEKEMRHYAETTSYAGHYYGIRMEDMVSHMAARHKKPVKLVIPIDLCGANALQRIYGECVKTVYLKRPRAELVMNILGKIIPESEKTLRILALDGEERNEELCDFSIVNNTIAEVVQQIQDI
jgi:guanylate kinase